MLNAKWGRTRLSASPANKTFELRASAEGEAMSEMAVMKGVVVLRITSEKGGFITEEARLVYVDQAEGDMVPAGRVLRCRVPWMSVIIVVNSGEEEGMGWYQTQL